LTNSTTPTSKAPVRPTPTTTVQATAPTEWLDPSLTANEQLSAFRAQLLGAAEPPTAPVQLPPQTVPPPGIEFKQPLTINTDSIMETSDQIAAGNTDGSASPTSGGEDGDGSKRGNKRELSTSKRAAQNRAAQRAFRQRKENYIKVCSVVSTHILLC